MAHFNWRASYNVFSARLTVWLEKGTSTNILINAPWHEWLYSSILNCIQKHIDSQSSSMEERCNVCILRGVYNWLHKCILNELQLLDAPCREHGSTLLKGQAKVYICREISFNISPPQLLYLTEISLYFHMLLISVRFNPR